MTVEHQPIVFGPVSEGDRTINGGVYPMSGYGWSCTCHAAGFGYETEDEAGDWADRHVTGDSAWHDDVGRLYGPDDEPWCHFIAGSTWCTNGERCLNPNHRKRTDETSET